MSPSCFPSGSLCPPWQPEDSLASSRLGSKGACVQGGNCYSHNESQQGSQCKHIFTKLLGWGWPPRVYPQEHPARAPRAVQAGEVLSGSSHRCCPHPVSPQSRLSIWRLFPSCPLPLLCFQPHQTQCQAYCSGRTGTWGLVYMSPAVPDNECAVV